MLFQLRKVGTTKAVQNMKRVSMSYINFELAVRFHHLPLETTGSLFRSELLEKRE
jgi:hypothetical protein